MIFLGYFAGWVAGELVWFWCTGRLGITAELVMRWYRS